MNNKLNTLKSKLTLKKIIFIIILVLCTTVTYSQKIIFSEPYTLKNKGLSGIMPKSKILIDEKTQDRLLIIIGAKNLTFFLLNKDWKIIETFDHELVKNSTLSNDGFQVLNYKYVDQKWILIGQSMFDFTNETIDFSSKSLVVKEKLFEDIDILDKYQNKYRIPSARLQTWDYGVDGAYFITICTKSRIHFFGDMVENQLIASEIGLLANKFWLEIPHHFPFVQLANSVVMPNHIHGVLIIDKGDMGFDVKTPIDVETPMDVVETPKLGVSTDGKNMNWKSGNVRVIINQFKRIVTINARKIHVDFGWQPGFTIILFAMRMHSKTFKII